MKCAVIGLGEVGSRYAQSLRERCHSVVGFDPVAVPSNLDISVAPTLGDAVAGADVVLVMASAAAAPLIAAEALPHLSADTLYLDFTSASPGAMREIGAQVEGIGAEFVDVAILGPVSVHGTRVPVMLAGSGAARAAEVLAPFGGSIEVLPGGRPGDAMAHKLLRSIFMKGLASTVCEAVEAANAAGLADWTRAQIAKQLAGDGRLRVYRGNPAPIAARHTRHCPAHGAQGCGCCKRVITAAGLSKHRLIHEAAHCVAHSCSSWPGTM